MRLKFFVCPSAPYVDHTTQNLWEKESKVCKHSRHDVRSLASEYFAFSYLGIRDVILEEDALIRRYSGMKVPEMVAVDPCHSDRIISVEVKRICGNQLPLDHTGQERRKLKRHGHYIWPWKTTVSKSLWKAHPKLVNDLHIHAHHIVFVIPKSLSTRALNRLCHRIREACEDEVENCELTLNHVIIHVIQGDDFMFDRF